MDELPDPILMAGLTQAQAVAASMANLLEERSHIMATTPGLIEKLKENIVLMAEHLQVISASGSTITAIITRLKSVTGVDMSTATKLEMDAYITTLNVQLEGWEEHIRKFIVAQDHIMVLGGSIEPSDPTALNVSISALQAVLGQLQLDTELAGIPSAISNDTP